MQDIEALTKRIILIGKGKILMDGNLTDMKKQFGGYKKLTLEYSGKNIEVCEGMNLVSNDCSHFENEFAKDGHAVFEVDTEKLNMSDVIANLSLQVAIKDISIAESAIDDVVVQLYKQYEI
jgi:ABC-2 type transport system ATP-binding protein